MTEKDPDVVVLQLLDNRIFYTKCVGMAAGSCLRNFKMAASMWRVNWCIAQIYTYSRYWIAVNSLV
jgi:hypothetical protein